MAFRWPLCVHLNVIMLTYTCQSETWTLNWEDNFGGGSLDTTRWKNDDNPQTWDANHLQSYSTSQLSVSGGYLNISLESTSTCVAGEVDTVYSSGEPSPRPYKSGRISTLSTISYNSKIEVRAKLPSNTNFTNLWPAIWLYDKTTSCKQEIDIMEQWIVRYSGGKAAYHFNPGENSNCQDGNGDMIPKLKLSEWYGSQSSLNDGEFHLFTLKWYEDHISLTVDGGSEELDAPNGWTSSEFTADNKPVASMKLIINLAVCGGWCKTFGGNTQSYICADDQMVIDYVKVYDLDTSPAHKEIVQEIVEEVKETVTAPQTDAIPYLFIAGCGFVAGVFCMLSVLVCRDPDRCGCRRTTKHSFQPVKVSAVEQPEDVSDHDNDLLIA